MNRWVAVALALACACGKKTGDDATGDGQRSAVKPAPAPGDKDPPAEVIPPECRRYASAIQRLSTCHEVPIAVRDSLREASEVAKVAWAHVTPGGMTAVASACLSAELQARAAAKGCTFEVENPVPGLEGIPEACHEYAAAIELLARCEKLPKATRDALRESYRQTAEAWPSVPREGREALASACAQAADAVKQSAAACD